MATLVAFHGKSAIKQKYLRRVRAHRKADEIVKGIYWEEREGTFKGCAVGCTLHSSDHSAYETELGIPIALAYLEDAIFENLPSEIALAWPERFLMAAKPGANLSPVVYRFMAWQQNQLAETMAKWPAVQAANRQCAALHERAAKGDAPTLQEWSAARSAARSSAESARSAAESAAEAAWSSAEAARSSAWSAAEASAWSAARSSAEAARSSAWSAAESAAWSAAESAAESAAWSAAYVSYADKLIELMRAA
jgi:hypothetical protein